MLRIDHTAAVRERPSHVQTKLAWKIVVLNRLLAMRHRVYRCRDVSPSFDQHHCVAAPAKCATRNAAEFRRVRGGGGLHVRMVGATKPMDADYDAGVDVVEMGVAATLKN